MHAPKQQLEPQQASDWIIPLFVWNADIEFRSTGFAWTGDFITATFRLLALSGRRAAGCVPHAGHLNGYTPAA